MRGFFSAFCGSKSEKKSAAIRHKPLCCRSRLRSLSPSMTMSLSYVYSNLAHLILYVKYKFVIIYKSFLSFSNINKLPNLRGHYTDIARASHRYYPDITRASRANTTTGGGYCTRIARTSLRGGYCTQIARTPPRSGYCTRIARIPPQGGYCTRTSRGHRFQEILYEYNAA